MLEEEITNHFITGIVSGITRYLLGVILKKSDVKEKTIKPNDRQKRKVKKKNK